ncbi:MAG: NAD-dependent epimerase/dehydratase family protein [Rhodospirillales bacterium]|nr:NAD-dependent epimerase/dehydratase family protein [Rhodospirillales bacterium]
MSSLKGSRRLLILGISGFIGSHLLDRLVADGRTEIVGWDLNRDKIASHVDQGKLVFRQHSVADPAFRNQLQEDVAWADWIINLSAVCNPSQYNTEPLLTIYTNFIDGYHIVEMAADAGKPLVHFSTSEVYGRTIASYLPGNQYDVPALYELDAERTPLLMGPTQNQRWSYATAKQLMERLIYAYHKERNLPFVIIRPFNFFGPRMDYIRGLEGEGKPRVLACFLGALLLGEPLEIVDGGHARRTITSIHDAIDATLAVLDRPEHALNTILNIGNPANELSMIELAHMMRDIMAEVSGDAGYRHHPLLQVTSAQFYGPGYEDCDRRMLDISREQALLDWTPKIPVREVLRETIAYYYGLYGKTAHRTAAAGAAE